MIDHRAIEHRGERRELPGFRPIVEAGPFIRFLLFVGEHNSSALMGHGIGDDFANRKTLTSSAAAMAAKMETLRVGIDMGDPKGLARRILLRHASGKEASRSLKAVELQREFGTLVPHDQGLGAMDLETCILFDPICLTIVEMDHFHR